MPGGLDHRCGTCARFVRVVETIDDTGEVKRTGDCLLGVWPSPLYETSTCSQWVRRGEFRPAPAGRVRAERSRSPRSPQPRRTDGGYQSSVERTALVLPEDLLAMDADEFRRVLADVIRDELGVSEVELAGRWEGGELILKPGKEGLQEKRVPIDALFHKIILIRD